MGVYFILIIWGPADIEEKGVRMKLTVIDTPGFGDQINNENWYSLSIDAETVQQREQAFQSNLQTVPVFSYSVASLLFLPSCSILTLTKLAAHNEVHQQPI